MSCNGCPISRAVLAREVGIFLSHALASGAPTEQLCLISVLLAARLPDPPPGGRFDFGLSVISEAATIRAANRLGLEQGLHFS